MHTDVVDLRSFYRTTQGEVVRRLLTVPIRRFWGDVKGLDVAAIGYGAPYLRVFLDEAASVMAFMPAQQGVIHFPHGRANAAALVDDAALPLSDGCIDRLLLVHALEPADSIRALMSEAWRILRPNGEVIAVAAHRNGLWARSDETPFGTGRSFTRRQLARVFDEASFQVEDWSSALHVPPYRWRFVLRASATIEAIGGHVWPGLAGAIVMSARKRVYAPRTPHRAMRILRGVPVFVPRPAVPAGEPA